MADFTDLKVQTGVGDYHFNRYRIAFEKPPGLSTPDLAREFVTNFPLYLNSPFATVVWGSHNFNGKPTLRFHGFMKVLGIDLARPHTDSVVREWVDFGLGFTGQTLKREFFDAAEDISTGALGYVGGTATLPILGPILGPAGQIGGAAAAVHYNRMHFLAGRRSWRVDEGSAFGVAGNVVILETAAVERFSAHAFQIGDWVAGLEKKIPDIWISNLNNFVKLKGLTVVPPPTPPKAKWVNKNNVTYVQFLDLKDLSALKSEPEFADAYRLFPTILP